MEPSFLARGMRFLIAVLGLGILAGNFNAHDDDADLHRWAPWRPADADSLAGVMYTQTLKSGFAYFALVFGAGFVLGAIRVPFLVPRLGVRTAELIEMPFMLVVVILSARWVVRRFALQGSRQASLAAGLLALALLVAAELSLAALLQALSPGRYIATRDPVSGSVYLAMLVLFALLPFVLTRRNI